jgi:hypothetical protein
VCMGGGARRKNVESGILSVGEIATPQAAAAPSSWLFAKLIASQQGNYASVLQVFHVGSGKSKGGKGRTGCRKRRVVEGQRYRHWRPFLAI